MSELDKAEIEKLKKKIRAQERKNREIRDRMAMQRTIFANDRTLMAYLRTAITIIIGGFVAIKFTNDLYFKIIGIALIPIGVILVIYSFVRYRKKQVLIDDHHKDYRHTSHDDAVPEEEKRKVGP